MFAVFETGSGESVSMEVSGEMKAVCRRSENKHHFSLRALSMWEPFLYVCWF